MHTSMWELVTKAITTSSPLEQSVLYLLIIFSIVSWAIIFMKIKALSAARKNNTQFQEGFDKSASLQAVPIPQPAGPAPFIAVFKSGMSAAEEGKSLMKSDSHIFEESVVQRMQHTSKLEFTTLRWGLGFLASVASASPFIGLFGTVWGIMATFQNLGDQKSASLAVVAPGISAALIATAAGLAVAIPAVMFYNWFLAKIDEMQELTDMLIERVSLKVRAANGLPAPSADDKAPARASAGNAQAAHAPVGAGKAN